MQPSPPDPDLESEGWEAEPDEPMTVHHDRQESRLVLIARQFWNPAPLHKPRIDPYLNELSWPERTSEVICFALLTMEHWLSQGGVLREWLRLNIWVAVILALFAALLIPPVTAILEGAVEWTSLCSEVVANITAAVLKLPPIVLGIATLLLIAKLLHRYWLRRQQHRGGYGGYQ